MEIIRGKYVVLVLRTLVNVLQEKDISLVISNTSFSEMPRMLYLH